MNQYGLATAPVRLIALNLVVCVATGWSALSFADTTIDVPHVSDGTNGTVDDGVNDNAQGGNLRFSFDAQTISGGSEARIREWTDSLAQGTQIWRSLFYFNLPEAPAGEVFDTATFSAEVDDSIPGLDILGDYQVGLYHLPDFNAPNRSIAALQEIWDGTGVGVATRVGTLMPNAEDDFYGGMTVSLDATSALQQEYANDPSARIWLMASFEAIDGTTPITEANDIGIDEAVHFVKSASTLSLDFVGAGPVPGDYNGNGIVDAGDYTSWRDNLNATGAPGSVVGDGDNGTGTGTPDGVVDQADYDFWVANFGSGAASSAAAASVPEPAALILLVGVGIGMVAGDRTSRS